MSDEEKNILKEAISEVMQQLHPIAERPKSSLWAKWGSLGMIVISLITGTLYMFDRVDQAYQIPAKTAENASAIVLLKNEYYAHDLQLARIETTANDSNQRLMRIENKVLYDKQ